MNCALIGMGLWDRRDFVMAAGAAVGAWSGLTANSAEMALLPRFCTTVADTRYPASHAFAAEAARLGQRIAWIDGDITNLWYDELDVLWRSRKVTVSGLTAYGAFFCLERLALDRGLRVVFKGRTSSTRFRPRLAHDRRSRNGRDAQCS